MSHTRKPDWLKIKLGGNTLFTKTKKIVDTHNLHTICSSGRCPNMGECWERGTATFMIAGEICTRSCKFCNTLTGRPLPLNPEEPANVAESIRLMNLKYAVITSVDRDDLPDMGAKHWAETIRTVRKINPNTGIEVLIPDFQGKEELIDIVCETKPNIVGHNLETVRRLTPSIRSAAKYDTSLRVLKRINENNCTSKSGIMVGLGEKKEEITELMDDLLNIGCKRLTIGQYLQPTHAHLPVEEYVLPEIFDEYKMMGLAKGFDHIESGPLVRSSYFADKA